MRRLLSNNKQGNSFIILQSNDKKGILVTFIQAEIAHITLTDQKGTAKLLKLYFVKRFCFDCLSKVKSS